METNERAQVSGGGGGGGEAVPGKNSMMRDWFAGLAMQSLLIRGYVCDDNEQPPTPYCEIDTGESGDVGIVTLSRDSYDIADAMLAAREASYNAK